MLQRQDSTVEYDGPNLTSVTCKRIMRENKTNKDHTPSVISLQAIHDAPFCGVNALLVDLNCLKHTSGPLFQKLDALPIIRERLRPLKNLQFCSFGRSY